MKSPTNMISKVQCKVQAYRRTIYLKWWQI